MKNESVKRKSTVIRGPAVTLFHKRFDSSRNAILNEEDLTLLSKSAVELNSTTDERIHSNFQEKLSKVQEPKVAIALLMQTFEQL